MLKTGMKGSFSADVSAANTAGAMKSGELEVFATPALCACMEAAAVACVRGYIESDCTTVGAEINIKHLAPSVVGAVVTAEAELTEIDGKRLVFNVTARDANGEIGRAEHTRYIVNKAKFMSKAIIRSESNAK